jgi:hypothetical protein
MKIEAIYVFPRQREQVWAVALDRDPPSAQ